MLPALLDLAPARPVQSLADHVPQSQAQHQLSDHMPDIFQQLHQPFSLHPSDQELQRVYEEAQAVLVGRQLL